MKVLSLFDGISCGMVALERAGIEVEKYDAYEIDKNAIAVSRDNYPGIVQHGSVIGADFTQFEGYDLLIGGSPCQGFSSAGKQLNFDDSRSRLFFEYVRALNEVKPRYFLLENVAMRKEFEDVITDYLGVEPICINSNLVSAQDRKRLYWTNIPNVVLPIDKGIVLSDIVGFTSRIPSKEETFDEIRKYTSRAFDVSISKTGSIRPHQFDAKKSGISEIGTLRNPSEKSVCIIATHAPKTYKYPFEIYELSQTECERLQTLPVGYTKCISETAAKKAIGNGWTVDVIAHILSYLKNEH